MVHSLGSRTSGVDGSSEGGRINTINLPGSLVLYGVALLQSLQRANAKTKLTIAPAQEDGIWSLQLSYEGEEPKGVPEVWHGHRVVVKGSGTRRWRLDFLQDDAVPVPDLGNALRLLAFVAELKAPDAVLLGGRDGQLGLGIRALQGLKEGHPVQDQRSGEVDGVDAAAFARTVDAGRAGAKGVDHAPISLIGRLPFLEGDQDRLDRGVVAQSEERR